MFCYATDRGDSLALIDYTTGKMCAPLELTPLCHRSYFYMTLCSHFAVGHVPCYYEQTIG